MVAFNFHPMFEADIAAGRKLSTIRKTMRCKIGDKLQFYVGQRTKDCRKIGEGVCIGIAHIHVNLPCGTPWEIKGSIGRVLVSSNLALQEGFSGGVDFLAFFQKKYGDNPFVGYMHVWELAGGGG